MLVAFSDGLIEARDPDGQSYGQERLMEKIAQSLPEQRMHDFQGDLADHLQGAPHHDDISLVFAHFGGAAALAAAEQRPHDESALAELVKMAPISDCAWRYAVVLGAEELKYINTVPFLMTFVNEIAALKHSQSDVFLILTELFVNALDHGVLGLSSALKHDEDGMEHYLQARSRSLAALEEGRVEIDLAGLRIGDHDVLRICVRDSGNGFDWASYMARTDDDLGPSGRGIALVRALCLSVQYCGNGSDVVAYYVPHRTHTE